MCKFKYIWYTGCEQGFAHRPMKLCAHFLAYRDADEGYADRTGSVGIVRQPVGCPYFAMKVVATVNDFCPACKIWCEASSPSTESSVRSEVKTPVTQKGPQDGLSTCPNPRSNNASAVEDPVEQSPGASHPGRSARPTAQLLQGSSTSSPATTPVNGELASLIGPQKPYSVHKIKVTADCIASSCHGRAQ